MKEFLGGMMGMNKGIGIEDIKNQLVALENNVVSTAKKGNLYVVNEIMEQVRNNPMVIMDMLPPVIGEIVDKAMDVKIAESNRNMQTWFMETIIPNLTSRNTQEATIQMPCEYMDYNTICTLANKKSVDGTKIKYHFTNKGYMTKNENGNFYLKYLDLGEYPQFIQDNCKIEKKEGRKGKEELFFKKEFIEYIIENSDEIAKARETFKMNQVKNIVIENINQRVISNLNNKNQIESDYIDLSKDCKLIEEDIKNIINKALDKDVDLRNECYSELIQMKWGSKSEYWKELGLYREAYKKQNPFFKHKASQIGFFVFAKGYHTELLDIVCSKIPSKANKALKEYSKEKMIEF